MPRARHVSQRQAVVLQAELTVDGHTREVLIDGLSLTGARIAIEDMLPLGAPVALAFRVQVPGRRAAEVTVEATGCVAWYEPGSVGITFDGLRAAHVWALGKYLGAVAALGHAA